MVISATSILLITEAILDACLVKFLSVDLECKYFYAATQCVKQLLVKIQAIHSFIYAHVSQSTYYWKPG